MEHNRIMRRLNGYIEDTVGIKESFPLFVVDTERNQDHETQDFSLGHSVNAAYMQPECVQG